ncbi:MAG: 3'(2'),5'-bisphosphate nucleotidase CysQ [Bacteroidales bacterium]
MDRYLNTAINAAISAGKEIMKIYSDKNSDFGIEIKADNSPLTIADKKSDEIISQQLRKTGIPILSEEIKNRPFSERNIWKQVWIVDPLDGTKEFIKCNGEFTVNIALIREGKPVLGVIYIPVKQILYFGTEGKGSFKTTDAEISNGAEEIIARGIRMPIEDKKRPFTIIASRSHLTPETELFIEKERLKHPELTTISAGSSIKICLVCEGSADIYPRFAPTMEWDTAAGDGIARSMGLQCTTTNGHTPLTYNKENLTNPWFIITR